MAINIESVGSTADKLGEGPVWAPGERIRHTVGFAQPLLAAAMLLLIAEALVRRLTS